jgi:hypothetical protein
MRGPVGWGASSDQAVVASDLYAQWRLPFGIAEGLLLDATASMSARSLAVQALRPYWNEHRFHLSAKLALCSLSARGAGIVLVDPQMADLPLERVLNADEQELLEAIIRALSAGSALGILRLRQVFRDGNPVGAHVRQWLPSMW